MLITRASYLGLMLALIALALPATAAAATTWFVEGTGDGVKSVPGAECETVAEECTFRAAIEAANVDAAKDTIKFDTSSQIVLGSPLPPITQPLRIDATPCEVGQGPPFPCVPISAPAGSAGIDITAGNSAVEGLIISGAEPGIRVSGAAAGNKIEGNEIQTPLLSNNATGILILNGPNEVFANQIEGACCSSGIFLQGNASGNRIGGDTAQSENVIDGFQNGAISMTLPEASRNEVGRNRGLSGGRFIGLFKANGAEPNFPNQIGPPTIGSALRSSVSGTAKPGAKVRLFRKATDATGEIEGFLGQATADGSGAWKATFVTVPLGTFVAATQTLGGGTSELSATATTAADPSPAPLTVNVSGAGEVKSNPAGISCQTDQSCSHEFLGTVTLTAKPALGYVLAGWLGCKKTSAGTCTVTVDGATEVTAVFLKEGAVGPTGPIGPQGRTSATGAKGSDGPAGPRGPRGKQGPAAKVTCKVRGGKKPKVTCTVKQEATASATRLRWRLLRGGHAVRRGIAHHGRIQLGTLAPGHYRLKVEGRKGATAIMVG